MICNTNCLWGVIPIDEWMISHIDERPLARIMSHAAAFTYFSMRNVSLDHSTVTLLSYLANSSKLVYLDLSRQNVLSNVDFLGKPACLNIEYLLLDNCKNLDANSVIQCAKRLSKLQMLSVNGLELSQENVGVIAHLKLPRLFNLGLSGAVLSLETVEILLQNHPKLLFLQISNLLANKLGFRRLSAEYDVSISFI